MIIIMIFTRQDFEKLRQRDSEIFTRLFNEYNEKIYNFLIIKTNGDHIKSQELLSDTFYCALEAAPNLKNAKNILGWLMQIANCRFHDYLRDLYKEKNKLDNLKYKHEMAQSENNDIIHKEKVLLAQSAMENLKPIYKELIHLKYIEKKSLKEISARIQKSELAVTSLLYRARESLKKEISKLAKEYF